MNSQKLTRSQFGQIMSAFSGWLMDGYTTIAYAVVAITFSQVFFPANFADALLLTFLGLGFSSIARLIGAMILGNFLGDKLGRRKMLLYSIIGFSLFSFFIAFIPTYATDGYYATALLYALIFVVGLFGGAEYAGGTALSMESVPQEKRMPVGAFVQSGYGVGYFLILLVAALFSSYFGQAQADNLVWRAIFATTIIPGIITLIIRFSSKESPVFEKMEEKKEIEKVPLKSIGSERRGFVAAFMILGGLLLINVVTLSFYPTFIGLLYPHLAETSTDDLYNSYINLISLIGIWIGGFIAFFIFKRKLTILIFSIIFLISIFPIYLITTTGVVFYTVLGFSIQAFIEAAIFSTIPAYLSEVFSKSHRTTAIGLVYNGAAVPAGFGVYALLYFGQSLFPDHVASSWLAFLFLGSIVLIVGALLTRESSDLSNDPIKN